MLLSYHYSETLLPEVTNDPQDGKSNGLLPFLILSLYSSLKFSFYYLVSMIPHSPNFPLPCLSQSNTLKISLITLAMRERAATTI